MVIADQVGPAVYPEPAESVEHPDLAGTLGAVDQVEPVVHLEPAAHRDSVDILVLVAQVVHQVHQAYLVSPDIAEYQGRAAYQDFQDTVEYQESAERVVHQEPVEQVVQAAYPDSVVIAVYQDHQEPVGSVVIAGLQEVAEHQE